LYNISVGEALTGFAERNAAPCLNPLVVEFRLRRTSPDAELHFSFLLLLALGRTVPKL
jgi:hypothetical protein